MLSSLQEILIIHKHYRCRGQSLGWKCWRQFSSSLTAVLSTFSNFSWQLSSSKGRASATSWILLLGNSGGWLYSLPHWCCLSDRTTRQHSGWQQHLLVSALCTHIHQVWYYHLHSFHHYLPETHSGLGSIHHTHSTSLFAVSAVGSSCSMTVWNQTSSWRTFLLASVLYWTSHRAAWSSLMLRMASVWAHSSKPSANPATPYLPWRDLVTWSLRWPWRSQSLPSTGSSDKDVFLENPSISF